MTDPLAVGVLGVGSMGANHARVYDELPETRLVGVHDADRERAEAVAAERGTDALATADLLDRAAAVSVAVPTPAHASVVRTCLDAGVDALVEKPFVTDPDVGRRLASEAAERDVTLQVGHVERFNPAVSVVEDVLGDADLFAVHARRLGPPVDRDMRAGVVVDLMIHDLDVVNVLADAPVRSVCAQGAADGRHTTATLRFEDGPVATLTASRVTQRKVRRLDIVADERFVSVDYLDQSVEVYRRSVPEYVRDDGEIRYRHESVVERPMVERVEPLKAELASFVGAVRGEHPPVVPPEAGIAALELAREIDRRARTDGRIEGTPRRIGGGAS
ncbi:MAG: Gfo/Idh/MocA family oxidoreductase [Haloferacaceae archaeon]